MTFIIVKNIEGQTKNKGIMKKLLLVVLIFISARSMGQPQKAYWDFSAGTASPTSNTIAGISVSDITQGNNNGTTPPITTTSASNGYTGASGTFNIGLAVKTGAFNVATSSYFEFTLTPTTNKSVVLSTIAFGYRATSTGPQAFTLRSSDDAYVADLVTGTFLNTSVWTFKAPNNFSVVGKTTGPVTFRLYVFNGAGSASANTANFRIDDLSIYPDAVDVLPVTLTEFAGKASTNGVKLNWATTSEQNNDYFEVLSSADGSNFAKIGTVKGAGTSSTTNVYSFTDLNPQSGTTYYQLNQVDLNGNSHAYDPISIKTSLSATASVKIYKGDRGLKVFVDKAYKTAKFNIIDLSGRIVYSNSLALDNGSATLQAKGLTSGLYILNVFTPDNQILKEKFFF